MRIQGTSSIATAAEVGMLKGDTEDGCCGQRSGRGDSGAVGEEDEVDVDFDSGRKRRSRRKRKSPLKKRKKGTVPQPQRQKFNDPEVSRFNTSSNSRILVPRYMDPSFLSFFLHSHRRSGTPDTLTELWKSSSPSPTPF